MDFADIMMNSVDMGIRVKVPDGSRGTITDVEDGEAVVIFDAGPRMGETESVPATSIDIIEDEMFGDDPVDDLDPLE